jgi:hypothetical protein
MGTSWRDARKGSFESTPTQTKNRAKANLYEIEQLCRQGWRRRVTIISATSSAAIFNPREFGCRDLLIMK